MYLCVYDARVKTLCLYAVVMHGKIIACVKKKNRFIFRLKQKA